VLTKILKVDSENYIALYRTNQKRDRKSCSRIFIIDIYEKDITSKKYTLLCFPLILPCGSGETLLLSRSFCKAK